MNAQELKDKHPDVFAKEYNEWCFHGLGYDWWDSVYEQFKENGVAKGFDLEHIYFSGFWSQGDGACWTGDVDVAAFINANYDLTEPKYNVLLALVKQDCVGSRIVISTSGRHCHEKTMHEGGLDFFGGLGGYLAMSEGVYKGALVDDLFEAIGGYDFLNEVCSDALQAAQDYAVDMYNALEEEYEHLTSEEQFIESCMCNEVDFEVEE